MTRQPQSVSKLRKRLQHMYKQYIAIRILINSVSQKEREDFIRSLESVARLKQPRLSEVYAQVKEALQCHIEKYGVIGSLEEMERITKAPDAGRRFVYVAKWHLETLFTNYEQAFPRFSQLPPHARVAIDTSGIRADSSRVEYTSLEASLFEDMALLWNEAKRAAARVQSLVDVDPQGVKLANALCRAVVKATFNLLEGYLNGIAFDVALTRETSDSEEEKIFEWDKRAQRARPLSLRDKILQYPRLALEIAHPPISEGNCPELGKITEAEKTLRHALIHPTPRVNARGKGVDFREGAYTGIDLDEVAALVDTVIALIKRIHGCLDNKFGKVEYWLYERDGEGLFPECAFL